MDTAKRLFSYSLVEALSPRCPHKGKLTLMTGERLPEDRFLDESVRGIAEIHCARDEHQGWDATMKVLPVARMAAEASSSFRK